MKPRRFKFALALVTAFLLLASRASAFAEETEMKPLPPEEAEKALKATANRVKPSPIQKSNPQVIISGSRREVGSLLRETEKVDLYDAHEKKGAEYMERGEYQLALLEYEAALQVAKEYDFPGIAHRASHRNLARVNEAIGNYIQAIEHVQTLVDHTQSEIAKEDYHLWKGALEAAAGGQFDQAVQAYETLLSKAEDWERPQIQQRLEAMKVRANTTSTGETR